MMLSIKDEIMGHTIAAIEQERSNYKLRNMTINLDMRKRTRLPTLHK